MRAEKRAESFAAEKKAGTKLTEDRWGLQVWKGGLRARIFRARVRKGTAGVLVGAGRAVKYRKFTGSRTS